jgi:hypothetical protein
MYGGLLLVIAALWAFNAHLTVSHNVTGAKSSVDKQIRPRNFIASQPVPVQRGDIVVFEMDDQRWVRRLIALPGDMISVSNGGIFIDKKPIDTTFLEKGAPILPAYDSYTIPPNRIVIGSGAIEAGTFRLIEMDKPENMQRGEVAFSADETNRSAVLSMMIGIGYLFLLVFGPLVAERWLDPQERGYGVLKLLWYGFWLLALLVIFVPPSLIDKEWNFTPLETVEVSLITLDVRFTSLLMYFGASLKQSEIVSLITGLAGLASASIWVRKIWDQMETRPAHKAASPRRRQSRKTPNVSRARASSRKKS